MSAADAAAKPRARTPTLASRSFFITHLASIFYCIDIAVRDACGRTRARRPPIETFNAIPPNSVPRKIPIVGIALFGQHVDAPPGWLFARRLR
jgi:hypothetical protein